MRDYFSYLHNLLVLVNADIPPLNDATILPAFLPASGSVNTARPFEVCKKLLAIKLSSPKAQIKYRVDW